EKAVSRHHQRFSSTMDNMNAMLKIRPSAEEVAEKGVAELEDLLQMYDKSDDDSDEDNGFGEENIDVIPLMPSTTATKTQEHKSTAEEAMLKKKDNRKAKRTGLFHKDENQPWEISFTKTLLFSTIDQALQNSCQQTAEQYQQVRLM
ncbi:hypothetical protein RFI_16305, partial [Reticulomyxa filosa]